MRAANSGRSADLASLAIAQEAYESAAAERERWLTGSRVVAVPVAPEKRSGIEAAVGQELSWRTVLHPEPPKGGVLSRVRRRIFGGPTSGANATTLRWRCSEKPLRIGHCGSVAGQSGISAPFAAARRSGPG